MSKASALLFGSTAPVTRNIAAAEPFKVPQRVDVPAAPPSPKMNISVGITAKGITDVLFELPNDSIKCSIGTPSLEVSWVCPFGDGNRVHLLIGPWHFRDLLSCSFLAKVFPERTDVGAVPPAPGYNHSNHISSLDSHSWSSFCGVILKWPSLSWFQIPMIVHWRLPWFATGHLSISSIGTCVPSSTKKLNQHPLLLLILSGKQWITFCNFNVPAR